MPLDKKPKKIIITDDDAAIRDVLKRLLEKEGYEVFTAADGQEALAFSADHPMDLMILDIDMPGLNGVDVLMQIKERFPALPVIMLTGNQSESVAVATLRVGACEYLQKPVEADRLKLIVQTQLIGR